MIVYLDLIIISDFVISYFIITFIDFYFHLTSSFTSKLIASLISSISYLSNLTIFPIAIIIKTIVPILIFIVKHKMDKDKISLSLIIIEILIFLIFETLLVGIIELLNINTLTILLKIICLFGLLIIVIVSLLLISFYKIVIKDKDNSYDVIIESEANTLKLKGFYDTGNLSIFEFKPIIFVNSIYQDCINLKYYSDLKVNTINETKVIKIYKAKKVVIGKLGFDCFISFSDKLEFDCLLNGYLNLMGGKNNAN